MYIDMQGVQALPTLRVWSGCGMLLRAVLGSPKLKPMRGSEMHDENIDPPISVIRKA